MSISRITSAAEPDEPDPHRRPQRWQASFTAKEARRLGYPRKVYKQLLLWARTVVEYHLRLGTPRHLWEGNATHNDQFAAPYLEAGEQELAERLERDIDPLLNDAFKLVEEGKSGLDAAARHPGPVTTPETLVTYPGDTAVALVASHDATIEADFAESKQHHRRVARWVATIGKSLPWAEWLGLLGFISYYMDVPLLRPWEDLFGFTLAITVVSVVIYGQTRLVHEAAKKHNVAREAAADGNRHEAERAYTRRNIFIGLAATVAVGITTGLILRGVAVLGDARPTVIALLVFLAILTGLLMPMVSYLSVALDGSTISRERDSVASDLDADLGAFNEEVEDCRRHLARIAEIETMLDTKGFPDVCNAVQETVDGAYTPYNMARLLIGGLVADPPAKTMKVFQRGANGGVCGHIGTGIAGARTVNLGPLIDRVNRMAELDRERAQLAIRLNNLPLHPWAMSLPA